MIDHKNFESRSHEIKKFMFELHETWIRYSEMPSDKQIIQLGRKFYERDKDINSVDKEMMDVIRGFEWGMRAMRQIIEGNNLET